MPKIHELASYADELLGVGAIPDYSAALNGLQLENGSEITGIVAAVDFSMRAIKGGIAAQANLLIVHHGMFWAGPEPLIGPSYRRLRLLLENDIAVYSSHLPLDRHDTLGNNVLLAKELGLTPAEPFARFEGIYIGTSGETEINTAELVDRVQRFAAPYKTAVRSTEVKENRLTKRWAICTGAGASGDTLREAAKMRIDTLIVGEGPHWTAVHAEENDLAIIYAGHYATETLGVRALAQHLADKYGIPSSFISAPTGL
jgi:dinuclear metal center YbgI/SA1388 family protein